MASDSLQSRALYGASRERRCEARRSKIKKNDVHQWRERGKERRGFWRHVHMLYVWMMIDWGWTGEELKSNIQGGDEDNMVATAARIAAVHYFLSSSVDLGRDTIVSTSVTWIANPQTSPRMTPTMSDADDLSVGYPRLLHVMQNFLCVRCKTTCIPFYDILSCETG